MTQANLSLQDMRQRLARAEAEEDAKIAAEVTRKDGLAAAREGAL